MKDKYQEAIYVLSELLLELKSEVKFKNCLIEDRQKEIERLKAKLEYIESYVDNVSQSNKK